MGFGRGRGFSPPVGPPFPEGYTGPIELKVVDSQWTFWLLRMVKGETYAALHGASDATSIPSSSDRFCVQGYYGVNYYDVERKPLYFDTSSIPAGAVIASAILLQNIDFVDGRERDIHLVDAPGLHDPPVVGDYGYLLGRTASLGVLLATDHEHILRNTWFINQAGLDSIVKGGQTKWAMRTIDDINASAPSVTAEGMHLRVEHSRLIVTYWLPP